MRSFILTVLFCFIASMAYAGGVIDNNNNEAGDIFVGTGINHGKASVGTWTNPDFLKGKDGIDGQDGVGEDGIDGRNGIDGKGLKDQYKAGIELRILDTKRTTFSTYYNRDFNNKSNEVGVKILIKLGKSYEEKLIEELRDGM